MLLLAVMVLLRLLLRLLVLRMLIIRRLRLLLLLLLLLLRWVDVRMPWGLLHIVDDLVAMRRRAVRCIGMGHAETTQGRRHVGELVQRRHLSIVEGNLEGRSARTRCTDFQCGG